MNSTLAHDIGLENNNTKIDMSNLFGLANVILQTGSQDYVEPQNREGNTISIIHFYEILRNWNFFLLYVLNIKCAH